jgi:hypothetical protein
MTEANLPKEKVAKNRGICKNTIEIVNITVKNPVKYSGNFASEGGTSSFAKL